MNLHAKVARLIFLAIKPNHITMSDWDNDVVLGKNNELRNRVMMAADLVMIEVNNAFYRLR